MCVHDSRKVVSTWGASYQSKHGTHDHPEWTGHHLHRQARSTSPSGCRPGFLRSFETPWSRILRKVFSKADRLSPALASASQASASGQLQILREEAGWLPQWEPWNTENVSLLKKLNFTWQFLGWKQCFQGGGLTRVLQHQTIPCCDESALAFALPVAACTSCLLCSWIKWMT